jgi:hypothetical protein
VQVAPHAAGDDARGPLPQGRVLAQMRAPQNIG